jgi:hypothetical protein
MVESSSLTASRSGVGALSPIDSVVREDFVGEDGFKGDFDWSVVITNSGRWGDDGREGRGVARFVGMA